MKANRYAKPNATGKKAQERIAAYYRMTQPKAKPVTAKPKAQP